VTKPIGLVITEDLVPTAVMCGMTYEDAWDATPAEIQVVTSAWYKAKAVTGWINGEYVAAAIAVCFSKNAKYPDNPLDAIDSYVDPDMEVTEEQAEYYRKLIMGNFAKLGGKPKEGE